MATHGPRHNSLSQLVCRSSIYLGVSGWPFLIRIKGRSRFMCLLLCVFAFLHLFVMDLLSSNALPVDTPPARKPFSRLGAFVQKLSSLGTSLGRYIQASSINMEIYLSHTALVIVQAPFKFNFELGIEGGGGQRAGGSTG